MVSSSKIKVQWRIVLQLQGSFLSEKPVTTECKEPADSVQVCFFRQMRDKMWKAAAFFSVIAMCMCLITTEVTAKEEETSTTTKPPSKLPSGKEVIKVESSNEPNSDVQPNTECFCTYDQEKSLVKAHIGHKQLKRGDRIMRGEAVTFECRYFGRVLLWKNGFRFFGRATMTCSTCTRWQSDDLPTCNYTKSVKPAIGCEDDLEILPGGTVNMRKGDSRRFFCSNSMVQPEWDYGGRKGVSVNKTRDGGLGNTMFVSYLDIKQVEVEHSGRYECFKKSAFNRRFGSTFLNIQVNDTEIDRFVSPTEPAQTLPPREVPHSVYVTPSNRQIPDIERSRECFCTYDYENVLVKAKTGGQPLKRGDSITRGETVSIECLDPEMILTWQNGFRFFGKINMTCNICEKWQRKDLPDCSRTHSSDVVIRSEEDFKILSGGIVHVRRGQNSRFFCISSSGQPRWNYGGRASVRVREGHYKTAGRTLFFMTMDIAGADDDHSGQYNCYTQHEYGYLTASLLELRVDDYVSCRGFPHSPEFDIKYSNHLSVGSIATFSCSSPARHLIGSDVSVCQEDGTWSNPPPSCAGSGCSIGELSLSIPETVEPDMTGVNSEFVPSGSEMRLKCSDDSILQGNSKVLCGEDGKWKLGSRYECVPGCILNVDPSSHLLIHPVQDTYRFGEFVFLSCPPGEEMSTNVERLMCLGGSWTDSLPFCKE